MSASCSLCATTWASEAGTPEEITTYQTDASVDCKDCRADAVQFFKTGLFARTCEACGPHMGCKRRQTDATSTPALSAQSETKGSVMCRTCKAVWLKTPREAGQFSTYWYTSKEVCRGCQNLALEMIHTGKTAGKCAQCGDALKSCTSKAIASQMRMLPPRPLLIAREFTSPK